jgi:transposase
MSRTSIEKIALMKQYWRDGYSIPEIASMTSTSKATVKKYLKDDLQTWLDEHNKAAERKAKAELVPEPVSFVTDENEFDISKLSIDEFESYIEFEFSQCTNDYVAIKDLFYELRSDELTYDQVMKLRQVYELKLDSLTSRNKDNLSGNQNDNDLNASEPERLANNSDNKSIRKQIIHEIKNHLECKLPSLRKIEEVSFDRFTQHLHYWIMANVMSTEAANRWYKEDKNRAGDLEFIGEYAPAKALELLRIAD